MPQDRQDSQRDKRLASLLGDLKKQGLRMTPQRHAILRALVMNPGHPSVEDIHQALLPGYPSMSLATVYKTISLLKSLGQVLELEFSGRDNRFDGFKPHPHPHLICTRCGRIMDPDLPALDSLITTLSNTTGYDISSHRLDFYGVCPQCAAKG